MRKGNSNKDPYTSSAKWAVGYSLKIFFRVSPTGFLRISQCVGKSLKLIKSKLNLQATKGCHPVLGCELGRKRQGDRKIEGTRPRSVPSLKGSDSQIHPWLTASQEGPQKLPMERTQRAIAAAIQPSAPRRQRLFLDKERGVQLLTLPGHRGAPLQGGERGCRPLLVSSSHRLGGHVGTVFCAYLLPPSPAGLHRSLDFFFPLFPPPSPKD